MGRGASPVGRKVLIGRPRSASHAMFCWLKSLRLSFQVPMAHAVVAALGPVAVGCGVEPAGCGAQPDSATASAMASVTAEGTSAERGERMRCLLFDTTKRRASRVDSRRYC